VRAPWESEEAAFAFLLRVIAAAAAIVVLVVLIRALT
jgi:hypothetical protein